MPEKTNICRAPFSEVQVAQHKTRTFMSCRFNSQHKTVHNTKQSQHKTCTRRRAFARSMNWQCMRKGEFESKGMSLCRLVLSACPFKRKTLCVERCCGPVHVKRKTICVDWCCGPVHVKGRPSVIICVERCCLPVHARRSPSVSHGAVDLHMQKQIPLCRTVLSACTCKNKPLCVERCCHPVHAKRTPSVSNGAVIQYMQTEARLCRTVLSSCTCACKRKTLWVDRCCLPVHAKRSPSVSNCAVILYMQKEDPCRTVLSS
jgi:hypothetical protein